MALEQTQRYPEKRLQDAAIAWAREHWSYAELFDDSNAVGARMDSAGKIDERIYLIEVKVDVHIGIVDHADNRPSSLESKIAGALRAVYRRSADGLAESVNRVWDRRQPPIVVILARSFTPDAIEALSKMASTRSGEWSFDFRLWAWDGESIFEVLRCEPPVRKELLAYDAIDIPELIGRAPRAGARTMEEFRALARTARVEHLLDAAIDEAKLHGIRMQRRRNSIGLVRQRADGKRADSVIAIFFDPKQPEGNLWVGCWAEATGIDPSVLPGIPAPTNGFLNANRYLATPAQVRELVRLFAPSGNSAGKLPTI